MSPNEKYFKNPISSIVYKYTVLFTIYLYSSAKEIEKFQYHKV